MDVLHANGTARLLAVTQLLESLSRAEFKSADDTDLQHISNVAAILLRDSCDLLGVMGWRLQA
ncbi:short-chain dehydrogenase [Pseudomonas saponiphila]|uniref:short-chain dehydrogenase n=1 Tax=Pseudomonas saponiphila TaxID=556534 RepID=UPI000AAFE4E8|nr:short-chain dehydrogenase [Pseudomonas saponiphila]